MRLNLLKPTLNTFMLFTALSTWCLDSAKAVGEGEEEVTLTIPRQPRLDPFVGSQESDLIRLAEGGDRDAQDQLIERNFWGFLNKQNERGLWGEGHGRGRRSVNPISWDDIEERAIADTRYAYALIDNYSHVVRWDQSAPAFGVQFPSLFGCLVDNSGEGGVCADFTLGVLYDRFQSFPERIGFPVKPVAPRDTALKLIKRAAERGHPLATSAMGLLSYQGYVTSGGRNDIEPLHWYLTSKENKISQDALRQLLTCQRQPAVEEGTFQTEVGTIKEKLEAVWGRHLMQVEAHNPEGNFIEASFAIPQLSVHFKGITVMEEEALGLLSDLQNTTPGLLLTGTKIREVRDRARMLEQQTVPYVSVTSYGGAEYHTFGEENVSLATRLVTYIDGIEDRFAEATGILKKIRGYYETQLDFALGELMKLRVLAIAKKDTESAQRFEDQKRAVAELEDLFKRPLGEIDEECSLMDEVKECIKSIVTRSLGLRNQDFLTEHPYLI